MIDGTPLDIGVPLPGHDPFHHTLERVFAEEHAHLWGHVAGAEVDQPLGSVISPVKPSDVLR
jgi:hypothetical protein